LPPVTGRGVPSGAGGPLGRCAVLSWLGPDLAPELSGGKPEAAAADRPALPLGAAGGGGAEPGPVVRGVRAAPGRCAVSPAGGARADLVGPLLRSLPMLREWPTLRATTDPRASRAEPDRPWPASGDFHQYWPRRCSHRPADRHLRMPVRNAVP